MRPDNTPLLVALRGLSILVIVATTTSSCSPASSSTSPTHSSPSASATVSPIAGTTVAFAKTTLKPKHWGDPKFRLKATATPAATIAYTAEGPCTVEQTTGIVELTGIGNCTITATTTSGPVASASLSFPIAQAQAVITFKSVSVRYTRPFSYKLVASSDPPVALGFQLVSTGSDPNCKVANGKLTLSGIQPNLPADCFVEASAAASPNYATPSPVRAKIHVNYPRWDVDALSPGTIRYDASHPTVTVTIRESTGDTLGIDVHATGDTFECDVQSVQPEAPSPPNTTTFKAVIGLQTPSTGGYVCHMVAEALPPDYADAAGRTSDPFTITVVP